MPPGFGLEIRAGIFFEKLFGGPRRSDDPFRNAKRWLVFPIVS